MTDTLTARVDTMTRSLVTMVVLSDDGHTDCPAGDDEETCGDYGNFIG